MQGVITMILKHLLKVFLVVSFFYVNTYAQGTFTDTNPSTTEKVFGDPNKKTSDSSQAIYDQGGQNAQYRMTETERGLDFIKKEIANLKTEVATLKSQVQELQKNAKQAQSFESINNYKPAPKHPPKPTPF